jgi:hypothetical protein
VAERFSTSGLGAQRWPDSPNIGWGHSATVHVACDGEHANKTGHAEEAESEQRSRTCEDAVRVGVQSLPGCASNGGDGVISCLNHQQRPCNPTHSLVRACSLVVVLHGFEPCSFPPGLSTHGAARAGMFSPCTVDRLQLGASLQLFYVRNVACPLYTTTCGGAAVCITSSGALLPQITLGRTRRTEGDACDGVVPLPHCLGIASLLHIKVNPHAIPDLLVAPH